MAIISILLVIVTRNSLIATTGASLLFLLGAFVHSLYMFALGFLVSTLFESTSTANRVAHLLSLALLIAYFASGYLRSGIIFGAPLPLIYCVFLLEPVAFGTFVQTVHYRTKYMQILIDLKIFNLYRYTRLVRSVINLHPCSLLEFSLSSTRNFIPITLLLGNLMGSLQSLEC